MSAGRGDTQKAADDDRWLDVEQALDLAAEAGLNEDGLIKALCQGEVRARGYFVPSQEEAERNPSVVPVRLTSEFWCAQGQVRELWESPGIEDFPVEADIHRPSLEIWIDSHLQQLVRQHATRPAGRPGRPSPGGFLRALHTARDELKASRSDRNEEVRALLVLLTRADPDGLLGPKPSSIKHVIKHVFG